MTVGGLGSLLVAPTWNAEPRLWLVALIVLLPLLIGLEFVTVPLPSGGSFSMATVPQVATILLVPAPFAALVMGLSVALEQLARRSSPLRLAFNVGATMLTASIASWVMGLVGTVWNTDSAGDPRTPLPMIAVALTYFVVNSALFGVVLAMVERRSLRSTLRQDRNTVIPELAATAIGAQYAVIWTIDPVLVLLLSLPAWVISQSFDYIRRLASETRASVRSLAAIIDHRDVTTSRHSERVAERAARLARALGLPEPEVELIEQAAAVHDVGKIGVPDGVLLKPGPLTPDEQASMRRHTVLGAQILSGFHLFRPGAAIVRHHHEHWDGSGYPDGLAGEAIPIGARVVAVVDSFDAMTSDRPYRAALERGEALRRIAEGAGRQWDAAIVRAFLELEEFRPVAAGSTAAPSGLAASSRPKVGSPAPETPDLGGVGA